MKKHPGLLSFFTLFLVFSLTESAAQEFNPNYIDYHANYTPVTPNAANLGTYGNTPVDHATGVPQISIPLFTIQEDGVSIPISISYHASGVMVDELASPVGLKWTLNAGGGVFRQVNDKIDETGWLNPNNQGDLDPDWVTTHPLDDPVNQSLMASSAAIKDYFPDDFSYSFNGASGSFIFDKAGNVRQEFRSPVRISRIGGTGNLINFAAQDGQGNTYLFNNELEFSTKTVVSGSLTYGTVNYNRDSNISAWMIDRIQTKNNRELSFTYIPYQSDYTLTNVSHSISRAPRCPDRINPAGRPCGCIGTGAAGFGVDVSNTSIIYSPINKLVRTIESPLVRATFNYEDDPTLSTWKKKLVSIDILDKVRQKTRSFVFTYGKFPGDPRLRLDQLQEIGYDGSTKPPYKFYYEAGELPLKGSMMKDYLGYYNGKDNSTLVPFSIEAFNVLGNADRMNLADRNESAAHLKIGVLNRIEYPTGGSTSFEYDPNSVAATGGANQEFDMRSASVSNIFYDTSSVDGQYTSFITNFTVDNDAALNSGTSTGYTTSSSICNFDPQNPSIDCSQFNIYPTQGPFVLRNSPVFDPSKVIGAEGSVNLPNGEYVLELRVKTSDLNNNPNANIKIMINWLEEVPTTKYTGGLRVASVKDLDSDGQLIKQTDYTYAGLKGYSLNLAANSKPYGEKAVFSSDNILLNPVLIKSGYFYEEVTMHQMGVNDTIRTVEKFEETFRNKSFASQMVRREMYHGNTMVRSSDMEYNNTQEEIMQYWVLADKDFCFELPPTIGSSGGFTSFEPGDIVLGFNIPNSRSYFFRKNLLAKTTDIDYFTNSAGEFSASVTIGSYTYNDNLQMDSQELDGRFLVSSLQNARDENFDPDPKGLFARVEYTYPEDHSTQNPLIADLVGDYYTAIPISKKTYRNGNLTLGQFMDYDPQGNVTAVYRYNKGGGTNSAISGHIPSDYELHSSFRIDRGKPVEVLRDRGNPSTMLWDPSKNYLMAELQNVSKADLDAVLSSVNIQTGLGEQLVTPEGIDFRISPQQLQSLRTTLKTAFPKALITTYSYDPLVGIVQVTDPKDYSMSYEYDGLSRLEYVRDGEGKLVSENKYNYKNQN